MPFQQGNKLNYPRPKRYWISEKKRVIEARKSFKTLCEIRDGRVKEQEVDEKTGEVYDVAPAVREVRESCKSIMAYSVGLPVQEVQHTGDPDKPMHVTAEFDFGRYAELFTEVSRAGAGVLNGNGAQKPVHSAYPDPEAGDIS
jgi:hypothetical protein